VKFWILRKVKPGWLLTIYRSAFYSLLK
jgi:hypothetical protein